MDYTPEEYQAQLDRARREAVGQPCPTCGRPIREPHVALTPPNDMRPDWYSVAYCSHRCGGSWFRP